MRPGSLAVMTIATLALGMFPGAKPGPRSQGGRLAGLVRFLGVPPGARPIDFSACPGCSGENAGKAVDREDLIVNPNGTLRNAVVFLRGSSPSLANRTFAPPGAAAPLEIRAGMFRPHVLALRTGQPLAIRNSSACAFNPKASSRRNGGFNFSLAKRGDEVVKSFDREEIAIRIECNIHPWTSGWIAVLSNPFFAVTGEEGSFDLADLPPGEVELVAWHETLGEQSQSFHLDAGETKRIRFAFRR